MRFHLHMFGMSYCKTSDVAIVCTERPKSNPTIRTRSKIRIRERRARATKLFGGLDESWPCSLPVCCDMMLAVCASTSTCWTSPDTLRTRIRRERTTVLCRCSSGRIPTGGRIQTTGGRTRRPTIATGDQRSPRQPDRQTNRQRDRETERQRDRQTNNQTDIQTDRHKNRQTDKQTDRQTGRQKATQQQANTTIKKKQNNNRSRRRQTRPIAAAP